jgi:hypothetical protein
MDRAFLFARIAMSRSLPRILSPIALPLLALCAPLAEVRGQGVEIGFAEEFALSTERARTLDQLIPGSEEHFFYSCLLAQHEGRLDAVPPLLAAWIEGHGRSARVVEIETRQALLLYERDPAATFRFVRERLGLSFDHQRVVPGAIPDVPTRLDQAAISAAVLDERARRLHPGTLDGFTDRALPKLATGRIDDALLTGLLARLREPDVPGLAPLVVRQLALPRAGAFGSLPIHGELLLDQLEECARLRPALLGESAFVAAVLRRLAPNPDLDIRRDSAAREAYLTRLQAFADRLPANQNSLKAHVLHGRLAHDLAAGRVDEERLLAYLRLPRRPGPLAPVRPVQVHRAAEIVDPSNDYDLGFPPIGDDQQLVRACLEQVFVGAGSFDRYAELLRADWVRRVFAETKILAGSGDMQRWYALLDDPAYYEQLRDRVEIRFAPTVREHFALADPVRLEVDLKNVGRLLVKVFEIHTYNYLRAEGRAVDASIDLDGLVANEERTLELEASPLQRVRRSLEFPAIDRRGVFVVELIGNGISSRALIQKGDLQLVQRDGAAGHIVRIVDETGRWQREASLELAGRAFVADEGGEIVVPYSTEPGNRPVILRLGDFAAPGQLAHGGEDYRLELGVHVDREALLPGRKAPLLLRPTLRLGSRAIGLGFLEEPVLSVLALSQDGVASTQDLPGIALQADRETVHEIQVPPDLARLEVRLRGKVRSLSRGEPLTLESAPRVFELSRIEPTAQTSAALLGRTPDGYVLDLLGKDGEPKADRAVTVRLAHRDYRDILQVALKTDARGRIELGPLDGIERIRADGLPDEFGDWVLDAGARDLPGVLHGFAGATLRVPLTGPLAALDRSVASLYELRGQVRMRDAFDRLALADGFLELRGLPAGDYALHLKREGRVIEVHLTDGRLEDGWAVGRVRMLEADDGGRLQVTGIRVADGALEVRLAEAGPDARVHLVATRYLPPYDAFAGLVRVPEPEPPAAWLDAPASSYHAGREIGDEYRYILERRFATRFPGNMLARPSLLLNPWAVDTTTSALGLGGGAGGRFGGRGGGRARSGRESGGESGAASRSHPGEFPDLRFLPEPSRLLANLRPDADGRVRVPLAELGDGQCVQVIAIDAETTQRVQFVRDEQPLRPSPRHLRRGLAPDQHFARTRGIEFVAAGGEAVIDDVRTAEVETYDSLAEVFQLFRTVGEDPELPQFAFVTRWPELPDADKRDLYSRHACHELHLFLFRKDRAFFDAVIRPYLANKLDKTFVDRWLLGEDLRPFVEPWAFARLNVVEKILLAQRLDAEAPGIARQIREIVELAPPDPQRVELLFRRALASRALADDKSLGAKLGELRDELKAKDEDAPAARRLRAAERPGAVPAPEPAEKAREMLEAEEPAADAGPPAAAPAEDERLARDRRDAGRALYREPDPTRRYLESNYWRRTPDQSGADLIEPNAFWLEYAQAPAGQPFVSTALVEAATGNFSEQLLALAVLDLPFAPGEHGTTVEGAQLTLRAATPLLLVREQITKVAAPDPSAAPVLVSQNLFRLDEPFVFDGGERRDAYLSGELLVDVAYGCRVVVTNPTSAPRNLELLLQIPALAIPLRRGFETRGIPIRLDPYATQALEFAFYFPVAGAAPWFPVHVREADRSLAAAAPTTWSVVAEPTVVDTGSWEHVSQNGSAAEVLTYLDAHNLARVDLSKLAWRLRDRGFFDAVVARLRTRHVYSDLVWSYGVHHRDAATTREYLRHATALIAQCGRALESPLLTIDPIERRTYQQVEFAPLFHGRAHRFGRTRTILDTGVAAQYLDLLEVLGYRPRLDSEDWLSVTYAMLLQDRVEEALASFARIDAQALPTRLQYEYMRAYLDFFSQDHALARGIAERHRDHPVERWRELFREVLAQLDEAEGRAGAATDPDADRTRRQTDLAASEPALELTIEGRRIGLRHANLGSCRVSYFLMDVEFLFSTHPFVQQGSGAFAYVRPNRSDEIRLPEQAGEFVFDLPEEYRNANVLIEVSAAGISRRQPYYANSLAVGWVENFGQLQVRHAADGRPLPKVYVKVFAREPGGRVRFHKDGYTDLRGRFDYASLSGPGAGNVERFAVLVLSDTDGAVVRELTPPAR